uniref:Misato Segment II tubulin-like domain-containing protein n=1 Tax=Chromera velia CCMP2878 TaxID=1169474 RepID=A0A0G4HIB7_9ALVE|eukprot:Cvel_6942.t1-p1 / transcript=Cvel_6942.t1 / gene=Cvel_6942 / organism=Chromera_velia_CCMP2878 / gene_product=hypothetical protein / transcript_product=hypothetical protein / location=Cvel_scaffold351:77579-84899(+) / protein_length=636 / sequence_SO=supercontig / SO=protein_coding / is_pseudo=false
MSGGEILSVFSGEFSCFVGSHFWNLQDEISGYLGLEDPSVLAELLDFDLVYSRHEGKKGDDFRPRTIFVGSEGFFGAWARTQEDGDGDDTAGGRGGGENGAEMPTWAGGVSVHRADPVDMHPYVGSLVEDARTGGEGREWRERGGDREGGADTGAGVLNGKGQGGHAEASEGLKQGPDFRFSETVRYFTDFLKAEIRPQSLFPSPKVPGVSGGGREGTLRGGFGFFAQREMMERSEERERLEESMRSLLETSDRPEGLVSVWDLRGPEAACAAVAHSFLFEEVPKAVGMSWGVQGPSETLGGAGEGKEGESENETVDVGAAFALAAVASDRSPSQALTVLSSPGEWGATREGEAFSSGLALDRASKFETSAIAAVCLDCVTLPARLASSRRVAPLSALIDGCVPRHSPLMAPALALPFPRTAVKPSAEDKELLSCPTTLSASLLASRSSGGRGRGRGEWNLPGHLDLSGCAFGKVERFSHPHQWYTSRGLGMDWLGVTAQFMPKGTERLCFNFEGSIPVPLPFPHFFSRRSLLPSGIFKQKIEREAEEEKGDGRQGLQRLSAGALLQSQGPVGGSKEVKRMAEALLKVRKRGLGGRFAELKARFGIEDDDIQEKHEALTETLLFSDEDESEDDFEA